MATALTLLGNNSENNTHITGPRETANEATNANIAVKIKTELSCIDFGRISDSSLLAT